MEEVVRKKNAFYYIGFVSGILAIISCFVTIGFSVSNMFYSLYTLFISLTLLGINRIGFQLSNFKQNMIENIVATALIFVIAIFVSLTKINIYFLITAMFGYSLIIIVARLLAIRNDRSIQSIVFNSLCIALAFLFSFVFFFPVIYAKHATSVSNSNFMVLCFCIAIIVSSSKNCIFPFHKQLKIHVISDIIKKSLINEIILALLIFVVLCSLYFTVVEPGMTSYVDSLWYSFSVITTIGFGDVAVITTFGRILSVLLGICGIVVVAVATSFIVNFYNEMNKMRNKKELKQMIQEAEKEIEKEKTENKE